MGGGAVVLWVTGPARIGRSADRHRQATLLLDLIADVLDRLADLAPSLSEGLLHLTRRFVRHAFVVQLLVVVRSPAACLTFPLS